MILDQPGSILPIIQAPMAGVQDAALTVAVCNAGALGSLPAAMYSPEALANELDSLQALTSRPYNLNFFCHDPVVASEAQLATWRQTLEPLYTSLGLDQSGIQSGPARAPFDEHSLALVQRYRPAVVSFHFGLPRAEWVRAIREQGTEVWSSATTVDEAIWLQEHGADAIIAQGLEAGGHRGSFLDADLSRQLGTLALVPQIHRAISLPVIAAGGIADAGGIRAAMALGASAVQVGTAFLLSQEATTSAVHRRALASPQSAHTALTNVFTGRPARGIVNRLVRELGPMSDQAPPFPHAAGAVAPLRAAAEAQDSGEFSPLWCGQNAAELSTASAASIVTQLARGLD